MFFQLVVPLISLITSVGAILLSYIAFQKNYHADIQPIIVFYPISNSDNKYCWYAKNVGKGPAQGVLITGSKNKKEFLQEQAILFPTIMQDEIIKIGWDISNNGLIAIYSNIYRKEFTSVCVNNKNTLLNGNKYKYLKAEKPMWKLDKDEYKPNLM